MMVAARPQPGAPRQGRRVRIAGTVATVVLAVGATACGGRTIVLGENLSPTTAVAPDTAVGGAPTAVAPTSIATTAAAGPGPTTGATVATIAPTIAPSGAPTVATTARASAATTAPGSCRVAANRPTEPTIAGGRVASSAAVGVRLAHPAGWPLTTISVTAEQIVERRLIAELGLQPSTPLDPLVVRDPSQFPGLAVFKLPKPNIDLIATAGVMREFYWSRKFLVQEKLLSACLDGEIAAGLFGTNGDVLQLTWFVYRGDSMYFILGLADDDGSARTQTRVQAEFASVLETLRWLD